MKRPFEYTFESQVSIGRASKQCFHHDNPIPIRGARGFRNFLVWGTTTTVDSKRSPTRGHARRDVGGGTAMCYITDLHYSLPLYNETLRSKPRLPCSKIKTIPALIPPPLPSRSTPVGRLASTTSPPFLFTSNSALMSMLASSHLSTLSCAHLPLPSKPDLPLSCPSCPHLHPHTLLYSPLSHLLTAFHVPSHAVTLSSMRSPPQLSALYIPLFVIDDSSNVFLLPFLLSFTHLGVFVLTSSLLPPCRLIPPSHSLHCAEATHLHSSTYHFCFSILFFSNLTPPLAF